MSPLALLLPTEAGAVLPDGKSYPAEQIWDWGTGRAPLLATDDVLSFMRDSDPRNWPEMEALLARELRGANESVRGAIASNLRRNKAHQERRRKLADEVSMATVSPYQNASGATLYRVRYRAPGRGQTDKRGFKTKRHAQAFA